MCIATILTTVGHPWDFVGARERHGYHNTVSNLLVELLSYSNKCGMERLPAIPKSQLRAPFDRVTRTTDIFSDAILNALD